MQKTQQTYVAATPHIVCFWSTTTIKVAINKLFLVKISFPGFHFRDFDQNQNKCEEFCCNNALSKGNPVCISISCGFHFKVFLLGLDFSWSRFFQIPIGTDEVNATDTVALTACR